jgi:hypothetical protein
MADDPELYADFVQFLTTSLSDLRELSFEGIGENYLADDNNLAISEEEKEAVEVVTEENVDDVFKPHIADEIDRRVGETINDRKMDFRSQKTLLHGYIVSNQSGLSSTNKDENMIAIKTEEGYVLQPHIRPDKADTRLILDDVMEILNPKFGTELHPRNIGASIFQEQLKEAIKLLLGKRSAISFEEGELDDYEGDVASVKSAIRSFYDVSNGKRLNPDKVLAGETNITTGIVYRPSQKKKASGHLKVLTDQTGNRSKRLVPLIRLIEEHVEDEETEAKDVKIQRVNLSGEFLIGDLSLKMLDSRNELYNYWEDVYRQGYGKLQKEYGELRQAFTENKIALVGEGETVNQELSNLIDDFIDFEPLVEGAYDKNLNYIIPLKPARLKQQSVEHKVKTLFFSLLQDMGLADVGSESELTLDRVKREMHGTGELEDTPSSSWKVEQRGQREGESASVAERSEMGYEQGKEPPLEMTSPQYQMNQKELLGRAKKLHSEFQEMKDALEAHEDLSSLQEVDPLFAYAYQKEGGAFKNTPIMEEELNKLKIGLESNLYYLDIDFDDDIVQWLEDLQKTAVSVSQDAIYYLPLSPTLEEMLHGGRGENPLTMTTQPMKSQDIEQKKRDIGKFLDLLVSFVEKGSKLQRTGGPSEAKTKRGGITEDPMQFDVAFPARSNNESYMEDIKIVEKEFNDLLDAVIDFYVVPVGGIYSPFDDDIEFITDQTTRGIFGHLTKGKVNDGYFAILAKEREVGQTFVDVDDIIDIAKILDEIASPNFSENAKTFKTRLVALQRRISLGVYGQSPKSAIGERLKEELGAYFYYMAKKNGVPNYQQITMWGEPVVDWKEAHQDNSRKAAAPFAALLNHIRRNSIQTGGGSGVKGPYARLSNDAKYKAALQSFNEMRQKFDVIKSDVEIQVLNAHDSIRKMIGKPIFYNVSDTDNLSHVSIARDRILKQYNVDISAIEVENIVNEFDSMDIIAKKYGVPSDSVYYLKANFR